MDEEIERIRERKRKQLRERIAQGSDPVASSVDDVSASESCVPGSDPIESTPDEPIHVDGTEHLNTLLERQQLVLIDFYADWCGPCQMLSPTLDRIAAETPATVAKVDTDAYPQLATAYGVRGLPTLTLLVDGEPVDRLVGMQSEERIRHTIETHQPSI